MTISYELAPNPKWYIADLVGRPLAGGSMYTYRSLNKTQKKFTYQDPAGIFPWTDPILFDENGSQGPIYWAIDSSDLQETYYIEVYDADGVLQWTQDNFLPTGGGGGTIITTALDLENLITNNVMWRNIGTSISPLPVNLTVAPGAHAGFAQTANLAGGDIQFVKNNTNAVDQITFTAFPLGTTPLTGDVTPVDYLRYQCSNAPAGETQKCFQFPITTNVQNLSNQDVTVTLWGFLPVAGGATDITLQWRQFFGDGAGASSDVLHIIQTVTLTTSWDKKVLHDTVPDVSGKVIGGCGNSALFLQVVMPFGAICDIGFTKPSVYLGSIAPQQDYHTYDMIDGVINAQRTGYIMSGFDTSAPRGYVIMNDGTIGSAASGGTTRANIDTFPLYNLLWNSVSDTYAPVAGGRGSNAIADFTANKALTLTRALGRVLGSAGAGAGLTARTQGEYLGSETISISAMPAHTHTIAPPNITLDGSSANTFGKGGGGSPDNITIGSTGGSAADGNMPPVTFMNWFIKL